MKEISQEEYKNILKGMLFDLDKICLQNNIKYFVASGTLLGTVRHDGFIPWDDDVDINIYYPEMIKLRKALENNPKYYILDHNISDSYYNNFPRLCLKGYKVKLSGILNVENLGPFIDLFVLYDVPNDQGLRQQLYEDLIESRQRIIYSLPLRVYETLHFKRKIYELRNIFKIMDNRGHYLNNAYEKEKILHRYDGIESGLIASLFDKPHDHDLIKKKDIEVLIRHPFENIEVNIPKNYDAILKTRYGNYMELPPVEQRITTHHFKVYLEEQ